MTVGAGADPLLPAPTAPARTPARPGSQAALLFAVSFLLALAAIAVARQPGTVAVVWLANGAATGLIATAAAAQTWPLLGVVALANLAANLTYGDGLSTSLAFMPANVLEVALGVMLTRPVASRFADDPRSFLGTLMRGAVLPPLLGATLGSASLHLLAFGRFERVWVDWYIGSVLGSAVALSLMLALSGRGLRDGLAHLLQPAALAAVAGTMAVAWLAFRFMPHPFVWCAVWLMLLCFAVTRLVAFANAFALTATLACLIAFGVFVPMTAEQRGPLNDAVVYLTILVSVLPSMLVAVMLARLRALGQTLSAVGSRTDHVVVLVDMQGALRWANRAREAYWGVPNAGLLGRPWAEAVGQERYESAVRPLLEQAMAGATVRSRVETAYPLRGPRVMDVTMQPALDEDGRQIGVLSCANDMTELDAARRELQGKVDQLRASNERLDQFVRIASHDLREPMNTIAQFCGLIEQGPAERLDAQGRLYFTQVREGAERMKTMLDDVLQFVRLEADAAPPLEPVDLDALLREVVGSLRAQLDAANAQLDIAPLGSTWGQRSLLMLVLQNLLSNGIKFMPPGRRPMLRVSAERSPDVLRLIVADNGIGIEPARLQELGTPFRRLHSRRRFEGTGLGLTICKRIAQQHGGSIEIESTPGTGSRFALCLPQRAAPRDG
jgi:PAS domain S-box-containing protein